MPPYVARAAVSIWNGLSLEEQEKRLQAMTFPSLHLPMGSPELDELVSAINAGAVRHFHKTALDLYRAQQKSPEEMRRDEIVAAARNLAYWQDQSTNTRARLEKAREEIRAIRAKLGPYADAIPGDRVPRRIRGLLDRMFDLIYDAGRIVEELGSNSHTLKNCHRHLDRLVAKGLSKDDPKALITHKDKAIRVIGLGLAARIRGGQDVL